VSDTRTAALHAGSTSQIVPTVILGGAGYVAGELLRILAGHPVLRPEAVVSTSRTGEPVVEAFPHLAGTGIEPLRFVSTDDVVFAGGAPTAVFAATPHGETAALLDVLLARAEAAEAPVHAVDLSADFRFRDPGVFTAIYGRPHGAPQRAREFVCAVPEHARGSRARHAAQPGCFTTAAVLAAYPFFALDLVQGPVFVSAITGSSGSGRVPGAGTHHPERRSALYAYSPLAHRHEAEMRALLAEAVAAAGALAGDEAAAIVSTTARAAAPGAGSAAAGPEVEFVPHSGPFVRGIHATVRLNLKTPADAARLAEALRTFYTGCSFVRVGTTPPRLNDVVGTNLCRIGIAARGRTAVVTSVIDNLVKGAAGGAVQWMNRLLDLPEDTGLRLPGLGVF
jgi:N-acetyl-gamma-glutamylphosphate reductase